MAPPLLDIVMMDLGCDTLRQARGFSLVLNASVTGELEAKRGARVPSTLVCFGLGCGRSPSLRRGGQVPCVVAMVAMDAMLALLLSGFYTGKALIFGLF